MSDEMGKFFNTMVDKLLTEEVIGGISIAEVLDYVDLEVAFSPIIETPLVNEWGPMHEVEIEQWPDGRYVIKYHDPPDFKVLNVENVRIMRARYLLHSKTRQARAIAGANPSWPKAE